MQRLWRLGIWAPLLSLWHTGSKVRSVEQNNGHLGLMSLMAPTPGEVAQCLKLWRTQLLQPIPLYNGHLIRTAHSDCWWARWKTLSRPGGETLRDTLLISPVPSRLKPEQEIQPSLLSKSVVEARPEWCLLMCLPKITPLAYNRSFSWMTEDSRRWEHVHLQKHCHNPLNKPSKVQSSVQTGQGTLYPRKHEISM